MLTLTNDRRWALLPALATAHSHAFQRAMRGAAQRAPAEATRRLLVVARRDVPRSPTRSPGVDRARSSRVAFRELHRAGVRTVGEFHYVHHQPDGTPYDDRTIMSRRRRSRAAKAEGLRIALLRVAYHRAGPGRDRRGRAAALLRSRRRRRPARRRRRSAHATRTIPTCASASRPTPCARCRRSWIARARARTRARTRCRSTCTSPSSRARSRSASPRRASARSSSSPISACSARASSPCTRRTSRRTRRALLGAARAFACVCATTERDLGDGLPDLGALRARGRAPLQRASTAT